MKKLTIHGYPLDSRQAIKAVIQDMWKTHKAEDMALSMELWATVRSGICWCCAGGSAVIHGMGGARHKKFWSWEEKEVATFFNYLREGAWDDIVDLGFTIPESAQDAWSHKMRQVYDDPEAFFAAWERFADAMPEEK